MQYKISSPVNHAVYMIGIGLCQVMLSDEVSIFNCPSLSSLIFQQYVIWNDLVYKCDYFACITFSRSFDFILFQRKQFSLGMWCQWVLNSSLFIKSEELVHHLRHFIMHFQNELYTILSFWWKSRHQAFYFKDRYEQRELEIWNAVARPIFYT